MIDFRRNKASDEFSLSLVVAVVLYGEFLFFLFFLNVFEEKNTATHNYMTIHFLDAPRVIHYKNKLDQFSFLIPYDN